MFTVDSKFECKEECWSTYRKPVEYECPICKGIGSFLYNDYHIGCKNCHESGKLNNSKQYVLDVCKVKVRKIKVSNFGNLMTISYVVDPLDYTINIKNRNENNLFKTQQEADDYCIAVNKNEITGEF